MKKNPVSVSWMIFENYVKGNKEVAINMKSNNEDKNGNVTV